MKTTIKEKSFDTVSFFRKEKERIARETQKMNFAELRKYLAKRSEWLKEK
ncbi:MAG: hypothetical protein GDA51_04540 [Ekhidna sp.]|nr:hypothetical protein [Ekhidna sp.]MBC6425732.1 hypothetical protein [Ekhidna sp.]